MPEVSRLSQILPFILVSFILMLFLVSFIVSIIYKYQKRQHTYFTEVEQLKASHENELLKSQIEMQEQTFQNISREIHDNIGQKLTLAKLHLNTLNFNDTGKTESQVNNSIDIITDAINDLSDISRGMNSELILNSGLIKALEFEVAQLQKSGQYQVQLVVSGNAVFLNEDVELVLFRIVQEVINNIIKHAQATNITMQLNYTAVSLQLVVTDNGKGFLQTSYNGSGLHNMKKRTQLLNGTFKIQSPAMQGTTIIIEIPLTENN
ncbi:MAG: sensor histidine kinase [Chitinophagaceae bacterium]|nr:sensor histidine kinase [Chitinophagaceae bacterium]